MKTVKGRTVTTVVTFLSKAIIFNTSSCLILILNFNIVFFNSIMHTVLIIIIILFSV